MLDLDMWRSAMFSSGFAAARVRRPKTSKTALSQFLLASLDQGISHGKNLLRSTTLVFSLFILTLTFNAYADDSNEEIGQVNVQLFNGTVAGNPILADVPVTVLKANDEGKFRWYANSQSNEQGVVQLELPAVDNGALYQIRVKTPTNQKNKYSEAYSASGDYQFVVGNLPVIVQVIDALTEAPIVDNRVTAYRLNADGSKNWYSNIQTDSEGKATFDLDGISEGNTYAFRTKVFSEMHVMSEPVSAPGEMVMTMGDVQVQLLDGSSQSKPAFADTRVNIYYFDTEGKRRYYNRAVSDSNGSVRLNLKDIDQGVQYVLSVSSNITGQALYSPELSQVGEYQFTMGNLPLNVSLTDAITAATFADVKVIAEYKQADGSYKWFARRNTDENGLVAFDLPGLGVDTEYRLRAKAFGQQYYYSTDLNATGDFNFAVANTAVTLVNGADANHPAMADTRIALYKLVDGKLKGAGSGTTDANGVMRFDLQAGVSYQYRAKSTTNGQNQYSEVITSAGEHQFVVGNIPLNVTLVDAIGQNSIADVQVNVEHKQADGEYKWFARETTDSNGLAVFDLPGLGAGEVYRLRAKAFGQQWFYSDDVTSTGEFQFAAGNSAVTLVNGSQSGFPALVNTSVAVYQVVDGERKWYSSGTTDTNGVMRFDLQAGERYQYRARSTITGQYQYSGEFTTIGQHQFAVGNMPLNVTLKDALSHQAIADVQVTVEHKQADGSYQWFSRHTTDDNGQTAFDLPGLGAGSVYRLRAKAYGQQWFYSDDITTTGEFSFATGNSAVTLVNGSVNGNPVMADTSVALFRVVDGERQWDTSGKTDANGVMRFDLQAGVSYQYRANSSVNGQTKYSEVFSAAGQHQFVVGNMPLNVTLVDAINQTAIADVKITVEQLQADGSYHWFSRQKTDANGQTAFDLPGLGVDKVYRLRAKAFGQQWYYSNDINATGSFNFAAGNSLVTLVNGAVTGQPVMADTRVSVYRFEGDDRKWYGSGNTDDNGVMRFDFQAGVRYQFKANSTVNGQQKWSAVFTGPSQQQFVVGNPAVEVRLSNMLSGEVYADTRVTAYQLDTAGNKTWYTRVTTDTQGLAFFDLDGINQGQSYIFQASVLNTGYSYSQPISQVQTVDFAVGGVPVTLMDRETGAVIANKRISAYMMSDSGGLSWAASGHTDATGTATFDFAPFNTNTPARVVFKAKNPFGENKHYYGPVITGNGAVTFTVKQGEYGEVDTEAPMVAISSPNDAIANAQGFTLTGTASDNVGVNQVEVTIFDVANGHNTVMATLDDTAGIWRAEIAESWLTPDQQIEVLVVATDFGLNQARTSRSYLVARDTAAPTITVTSHSQGDEVNASGFTLFGAVTDDIEVATIVASVNDPVLGDTVIDQALDISVIDGQWAFSVTNSKVSAGQNVTIRLVATDVNNNQSELSLGLTTVTVASNPLQLAQRITFGLDADLIARIHRGDDYLTEQLNPEQIDDSAFEAQMAAMMVTDRTSLKNYLLQYMAGSQKQLREVMAWFWENHFNTNLNTHGQVSYELAENQRFRELALGNFRDLLEASAKSSAMIHYLNSQQNVAGRANENYAREIMELHTMGVDGGYTATDIAELSKIFTGWHEQNGAFSFNDELHDNSDKQFLGQTIVGSGVEEGEQALSILAAHPSTASYICSKLVTLFVSDVAISSLQNQCAAEFLATNGEIKSVLQLIFSSNEFVASENHRNKVKTPLELVLATVRGFADDFDATDVNRQLGSMGMRLFEYPVPTGFSEHGEDWVNSNAMLQRIRLVTEAAVDDATGYSIDFRQLLLNQGYSSADAVVSFLFELALGNEFTDLEHQMALEILNQPAAFDINNDDADEKLRRLLGTVLSFPGYQYQ